MSRSALDRSLVSGVAWTSAAKLSVQVVRWSATLLIARILDPDDYGIVGMAVLFTALIQLVSEFGLGAAIIHRQDRLEEEQIAKLGGVALAVGVLLAGLAALGAPLIAGFFGEPAVTLVIMALSLEFILEALRVLPRALLTRDLQFRTLAGIEIVGGFLLAGSTLGFALMGAGYWALVGGVLCQAVLTTGLSLWLRPHRVAFPRDLGEVMSEMKFGLQMVIGRVSWYAYSNADFGVVGRIFGKTALGNYTIGWNLASVPVERITTTVSRIALPIFSKLQDDLPEFQRTLRNLTQVLSILTFPAVVGLALVADVFVVTVLGEKWVDAILPLRILALAAVVRSVTPVLAPALIALGQPHVATRFSLICFAILPVLFVVAANEFGPIGPAWVWMTAYPVLAFLFLLRWTCRRSGLRVRDYLLALWPASSATALMALSVWWARQSLFVGMGNASTLFASAAVGLIVYLGVMGIAFRRTSGRIVSLVRDLRN